MEIEKVNFRRMPRNLMIQALDIHPETFDAWVIQGAPIEEGSGRTALHDIGKFLLWRVEKEKASKKNQKKIKVEKETGEMISDPEVLLREKILVQDLRKKTLDNDEREGSLVNKKEHENLSYLLGRTFKETLMSQPAIISPQIEMKSAFEINVFLIKCFQNLCNRLRLEEKKDVN